ncbi:MAG: NTP transferase domain-containing protein [Oscillospiraceae bacterium]|nr:NTP transferase domain-containing protein [Oscillospiraceae bacterium]
MSIKAVVLAAGKGTRLQTEGVDLPKVMRRALDQPLLHYVLDAIRFIPPKDTIIVVGYQKEKVIEHFPGYVFAEQVEQLGTGHAVMAAEAALGTGDFPVLVCYGDMPLLRREAYEELVQRHLDEQNACTILTGTTDLSLPFGRIIRDAAGNFQEVVEDRDCTPEQKAIDELNVGVYVFQSSALLPALGKLGNENSQGEYYLTDVPAILKAQGLPIGICKRNLGLEIVGVNTVEQLVEVEEALKARLS